MARSRMTQPLSFSEGTWLNSLRSSDASTPCCRGTVEEAPAQQLSMTGHSMSAPPPLRPVQRVPPEKFQLPVEKFRDGYYSDKYFSRTRDVLLRSGRNPRVTVQV